MRLNRLYLAAALVVLGLGSCGSEHPVTAWGPDLQPDKVAAAQQRGQLALQESPGSPLPSSPVPSASSSPVPSGSPAAPGCANQPPAAPLAAADLVGEWIWLNGVLYEPSGADYYATVSGDLVLGADGHWSGARETHAGQDSFVAYGPGTWSFDGRAFALMYDDGSDTETYGTVYLGTHADPESGQEYRALTLEIAYETGDCLIYLLIGPPL